MKKKKDDIGFQEFIDQLFKKEDKKITRPKRTTNFNIQGHLSLVKDSLTKLILFFGEKISISKEYSNTDKLIAEQKKTNSALSEELRVILVEESSPLHANISEIFNSTFTK